MMGIAALVAGGRSEKPGPVEPTIPSIKTRANLLAASTLKGTAGEYKALGPAEAAQLGQWLLENKAVRFGSTPKSVMSRIGPLKEQAAQGIDSALSRLDATGANGLDKAALRDAFLNEAVEASKLGPSAANKVEQYLAAAQQVEKDMASSGRYGSFTQGEQWKRGYQETAYPKGRSPIDPTPAQVADQRIASIARQQVEDAAEKAAAGGPDLQAFLKAKSDYGASRTAERMLEGASGREAARNLASPSDKALGIGTLLATGNAPAAVAAAAANHVLRTRAASSLSVLLDQVAKMRAPPLSGATPGALAAGRPLAWGLPVGGASEVPGSEPEGTKEGASTGAPAQSTPAGSVDAIVSRLSADPRMRPYADLLKRAGPQAAPGLHFQLYQKDPTYRAAVMAGEQSK